VQVGALTLTADLSLFSLFETINYSYENLGLFVVKVTTTINSDHTTLIMNFNKAIINDIECTNRSNTAIKITKRKQRAVIK